VKRLVRNNGLLLACLGLFGVFFVGMVVSGTAAYNDDQREHGSSQQLSVVQYLRTGDFVEATFENWESEFLQMGMYVVLTAFLYQRGSAESKPMDRRAPQDADPTASRPAGGVLERSLEKVYENSLAGAFFLLFFASMTLHALGGVRAFNQEGSEHGQPAISVWRYVTTAQFWFESMQNWQSEFIAVAAIVGLSVVFRQRGSAESKPVAARNDETGG